MLEREFNASKSGTPRSAPYLTLKNNKKASKCQVLSSTVPEKPRSWTELTRFRNFYYPFCCKKLKKKGNTLKTIKVFRKKYQCRKKTLSMFSWESERKVCKISRNIEGDPSKTIKNFRKKISQCRKS